jgi:rhomboid-like protein
MERRLIAVPAIVGVNVLVFAAWWVAQSIGDRWPSPQQIADGSGPLVAMARHFLTSPFHLQHGWVDSVLLAGFSHIELFHILVNMFVLWSFGSLLERLWGLRMFVSFYLAALVFANLCHSAVSAWLLGDQMAFALGASGAVSGVLIAFSLMFPEQKILLFGIVPLPAWIAALLFVGLDVWGLIAQQAGGGLPIGHGAHLGGALAGLVFWATVLRRRFRRLPMRQPPSEG